MKFFKVILKIIAGFIGLVILIFILLILDSKGGLIKLMSIRAGSYQGRVVDDATGEPVEGAAVYMSWLSMCALNPLEAILDWESGYDYSNLGEILVFTDADGYYRAPEKTVRRWVRLRMGRPDIEVLIYKKGYVAYNDDSVFNGKGSESVKNPVGHFSKKNNLVRLKPWQEEFSHQDHYHYMESIYSGYRTNWEIYQKIDQMTLWETDDKYWDKSKE